MNRGIWRKLIEVENPLSSIEQWYRRATALDRNWRESRREIEEERSRRRTETGETEPAMIFSVVEEATIASAGNNKAYSDRGD